MIALSAASSVAVTEKNVVAVVDVAAIASGTSLTGNALLLDATEII